MLARAMAAFLALPAVVGVVVPWLLVRADRWRGGGLAAGAGLAGAGAVVLLWCVRDFYVFGRGTLAPWSPPERLVVVGLYRVVRNPMYIGVLMLVAGTALWRTSPVVGIYAVGLAVAFHVRVVRYEEPWLARTFPGQWGWYVRSVPRWTPRLRPWRGVGPGSSPGGPP